MSNNTVALAGSRKNLKNRTCDYCTLPFEKIEDHVQMTCGHLFHIKCYLEHKGDRCLAKWCLAINYVERIIPGWRCKLCSRRYHTSQRVTMLSCGHIYHYTCQKNQDGVCMKCYNYNTPLRKNWVKVKMKIAKDKNISLESSGSSMGR